VHVLKQSRVFADQGPVGHSSVAPAFDIDIPSTANTVILPHHLETIMNKSESDRISGSCAQIAVEEDRAKFLKLVQELNRVLSTKDPQIQNDKPSDPKSK